MRRVQKQVLGFLGLGAVLATTAFAATLPSPGASAVTTDSVTDTIQVRVYEAGSVDIRTSYPEQVTNPNYEFAIDYSDMFNVRVEATNRNANGAIVSGPTEIYDEAITEDDKRTGTKEFSINLDNYGGVGIYTITVYGTNASGVVYERSIMVTYTTPSADIAPESGDGEIIIDVTPPSEKVAGAEANVYDKDGTKVLGPIPVDINNPEVDLSGLSDGDYKVVIDLKNDAGETIGTVEYNTTNTVSRPEIPDSVDSVDTIKIEIYDEDGNIVKTVIVDRNTGTVYIYDANGNLIDTIPNGYVDGKLTIPTDDLASGRYTIKVTYYAGDRIVGIPYSMSFDYEEGEIIPVPDTGAFFQNLNISKEDYLITGLIVFFVLAIVGFGVVSRNNKTTKKTRRK